MRFESLPFRPYVSTLLFGMRFAKSLFGQFPRECTVCGYKGTATYWRARVGDEWYDDVAWSYEAPRPEATAIRGLLCFEPQRAEVSADFPTTP